MWTHVLSVPHVFVSRLLQCISHASQKHQPLWSYVPTVRPSGKCGCSLGSADLNERWNNTNLQEHETAPKRQIVDYGSVSQQNNAEEIDRARLPERVHEPKLTLTHEFGKRHVHNKRTRLCMRKKDTVTPKIMYHGHTQSSHVFKSEPPTVQEDIIEWLRGQPSSRSLLTNEEEAYQHMESIQPETTTGLLMVMPVMRHIHNGKDNLR